MELMTWLLGFVVLALAGCDNRAEKTVQTSNENFQVEQLFEHEGCRVYRFVDGGRTRYFVSCQGRTMRSERHTCGKSCSYTTQEEIQTEVTR